MMLTVIVGVFSLVSMALAAWVGIVVHTHPIFARLETLRQVKYLAIVGKFLLACLLLLSL